MAELAPHIPAPGQVMVGRYRIESVLGKGGMGTVFAATDIESGRRIAIKVLEPEAYAHPDAGPRFVNEARAAMRLTSPHVTKVYEVGTFDGGLPYMAMELLEGADLAAHFEQRKRLPVGEVVSWVIEATVALAEAHAIGIVHRDLKPSNLYIAKTPDGPLLKVLDFGISKVIDGQAGAGPQAALTATGSFLGSPAYVAPEQLRNAKDVDRRADIWSLGVILYELLTGKLPFDGSGMGELFVQILSAQPTAPQQLRPDLPPELAQVIARCLAKRRDDRYPDVAALAAALRPFAGGALPAPATPPRSALAGTMMMTDRPSSDRMRAIRPAVDPSRPSLTAAPVAPAPTSNPFPVPAPPSPNVATLPSAAPRSLAGPAPTGPRAPVSPAEPARGGTPAIVILALAIGVIVLLAGGALFWRAHRAARAPAPAISP